MSMHKIPLTPIEESGLRAHGLDIGKPSQLSDAFRQGVRYASAQLPSQGGEAVAWAICKEPGRVDWLSATYANKRAAEAHVASYKDGLTLYITPLYAAPATPAADAGAVLEQAMYTLISIGYHENSGLVHELRQALAAHRAKGVV